MSFLQAQVPIVVSHQIFILVIIVFYSGKEMFVLKFLFGIVEFVLLCNVFGIVVFPLHLKEFDGLYIL